MQTQVDRIRSLQAAGRHENVLSEAERLLASLKTQTGNAAWRIPFGKALVVDARIGQRYGYFVVSPFGIVDESRPDLPFPDDWLERSESGRKIIGWGTVTCVDLTSGKRLWTRPVYGLNNGDLIGLDPRDDALWVWPRIPHSAAVNRLRRYEPADGRRTFQVELPPLKWGDLMGEEPQGLQGIRTQGISFWGRWHPDKPVGDAGFEYDLETLALIPDAHPPESLSPNRLAYAAQSDPRAAEGAVVLRPIGPHETPVWSAPVRGRPVGRSIWVEAGAAAGRPADVLAVSGMSQGNAVVYRLNGKTGAEVWRRELPEPAYEIDAQASGQELYIERGWPIVGLTGGYVTALGRGTAYLLDPDDGTIHGRTSVSGMFIDRPRIVDGMMVIATTEAMTAIPLEQVLGTTPPHFVELRGLQVRSLLALQRFEEAWEMAQDLAKQAPGSPEAWRSFAAAAELHPVMNKRADATALHVRAMQVAGQETSQRLRESHGLIRSVKTSGITAALVPAGPLLLAGTQGGELLTIDPATGDILDVEQQPGPIQGLMLEGQTLSAYSLVRPSWQVRTFATPPELPAQDPLLVSRDGSVVINGTRVEPRDDGAVRLERGGITTDLAPAAEGVGKWGIRLVDGRPLGVGPSGVWALDDQYRPVTRLLKLDPVPHENDEDVNDNYVRAIAGGGGSVCVVVGAKHDMSLQIWTADFGRLVREEPLPEVSPVSQGRLLRLGDGYLFAGVPLLWLPEDPGRPPWRFDLRISTEPVSQHPMIADPRSFGPPRLIDGRLFVPGQGANLWIFDAAAITGE